MTSALMLLVLLAQAPTEPSIQPNEPCQYSFAQPPDWPSFMFHEMDAEALRQLTLTRKGVRVVDIPEGAIVLGWLGTSMRGDALHVWVYTRPDRTVSSRLLHGDALERLYADVVAWLKEHKK